MEQSLQYQLPLKRSWVRPAPTLTSDGPKIAFALFLAFIVMLYSNVSVIYKAQLDALRPTLVVAIAALSMMVIELGQRRLVFKLMWPQGVLLIALLGVCVVSTFNAIYVRHAADTTMDFAKIVLVYLLIENVVTSEARLRKVAFTMVCCGLFPAIGIIYHYQTGVLVEQSRAAWRGIFGNPNEAAYGLLVLIPLALALAGNSRLRIRLAMWLLVGVFLVAMFLTFSRGAFIGLFAVLGLMAWRYDSIVIKAGMIVALLAGILVVGMFWKRSSGDFSNVKDDTSVQERMYTFHAAIQMFLHNPVLGVGPGDSLVAYPIYAPPEANCGCHKQLVVHNSYLQALGELGAVGCVAFILFIGIPVYQAWKMQRGPFRSYAVALELAMWGFLICSLSGGYVYTWWPYILVGLIAATKRISDSNITENSPRGVHAI